jgi:hypothetical protein
MNRQYHIITFYLSGNFILPIIMVGQNVLGRKSELQADEQFNTTQKSYHDIEQIMQHMAAQDEILLKQSRMIIHLLQSNGATLEQILEIQQMNEAAPNNNVAATSGNAPASDARTA